MTEFDDASDFEKLIYRGLIWDIFFDVSGHVLDEYRNSPGGDWFGPEFWHRVFGLAGDVYDIGKETVDTVDDVWDFFSDLFRDRNEYSGRGEASATPFQPTVTPQSNTSNPYPIDNPLNPWRDPNNNWVAIYEIDNEWFHRSDFNPSNPTYRGGSSSAYTWSGANAYWQFLGPIDTWDFPGSAANIWVWGPAFTTSAPAPELPPSQPSPAGPSGGGSNSQRNGGGFSSLHLSKKRRKKGASKRNANKIIDQPAPGIDWAIWR